MAGIPVGTNNELPALATQHSQVLKKRVHETVFACLSSVRGGTRWHVEGDNAQTWEIDLNVTALSVDQLPVEPCCHLLRFLPTKNSRARISGSLCLVVKTVVPLRIKKSVCELHFFCFNFLNADDVGILVSQPAKKAFSSRRPDAVCIAGNHSEHGQDTLRPRRLAPKSNKLKQTTQQGAMSAAKTLTSRCCAWFDRQRDLTLAMPFAQMGRPCG